jgi:tRNA A-37 threonylcarbamoyl transferase component Bud32
MPDRLALLEARLARLDGLPPLPGREPRQPKLRHGLPPIPGEKPAPAAPEPRVNPHAKAPGGLQGQPCGNSWISPDYTCHQGGGGPPAAASVPTAGSSEPAPDLRPTLSMATSLDTYLRNYLKGGSDMTRDGRRQVHDYAQQRGLSDWELSAVIQYTRLTYRDVNKALRGLELSKHSDLQPAEALVHAELIRTATEKLPSTFQPVWRGTSMDPEHLAEFWVGRIGADKGFQSTTTESPYGSIGADSVARTFASGELDVARPKEVIFEYAIGHGARSIDGLSLTDEQEALIPPGRPFRVVEVTSFADELERRKGQRELWAEGITLIRLEAVDQRLDAGQRLSGLLDGQGGIRGANHLHAGRFQPHQDFVHGAALRSRGITGSGQDHAVAESVGGVGHGDHLVQPNRIRPSTSRLDAIEARLIRLDKNCVKGKACGATCVKATYNCSKPAAAEPKAAAQRQPPNANAERSAKESHPIADDQYKSATDVAFMHYVAGASYKSVKTLQAQRMKNAGLNIDAYGMSLVSQAKNTSGEGMENTEAYKKQIERESELIERYIANTPKYEGDVWRGIRLGSEAEAIKLIEGLATGEAITASMESWSMKEHVATAFAKKRDGFAASVILHQANRHGAAVPDRHQLGEAEVLQPAGIRYRPLSVIESGEDGHRTYVVEVEAIGYEPMPRRVVMDSATLLEQLEARLERLDARRVRQAPGQMGLDLGGTGKPCGEGHIAADLTCHKGGGGGQKPLHPLLQGAKARLEARAAAAAAAEAKLAAAAAKAKLAAAQHPAGLVLGQDKQGRLLVNGQPAKQLSKGNYGDTYKVDTPDGPVLVKVDRLNGGDPMERDPSVSRERQRLNMATREVEYLRKAAALGIGPEPLGDVVKLPEDGRLAIAYRMVEGAPLKANPWANEPDTEEAAAILAQPGARERLDAGVLRIARAMSDAGLEHGDVHGANIVVKPDGSPVLIDWALADTDPPGAAANRADLEARMLLQMNYYTQTLNRHSPDGEAVANGLAKRADAAVQALRAASELQGKFDLEWEERNLTSEVFGKAMVEANRLVNQGLSYDAAQRQAGMLPMLTPKVKAATAAARDAIFGAAELQEMRQWVDSMVLGAKR